MDILTLITFVLTNQDQILDVLGRIVLGASVVSASLPTLKDNTKLNKVFNLLVNLPALAVGGAKPKESDGLLLGAVKLLSKKK